MPRREQQYKAFTAACNWINSHNSSFMIQWLAWPGTHRLSGSLYSVPLWLGGSRRPHLKLRLWQLIMHYILMPSSHQPYGSIFSWESSSLKSHSRRMDGRGSFLWISWAMCFWCFSTKKWWLGWIREENPNYLAFFEQKTKHLKQYPIWFTQGLSLVYNFHHILCIFKGVLSFNRKFTRPSSGLGEKNEICKPIWMVESEPILPPFNAFAFNKNQIWPGDKISKEYSHCVITPINGLTNG